MNNGRHSDSVACLSQRGSKLINGRVAFTWYSTSWVKYFPLDNENSSFANKVYMTQEQLMQSLNLWALRTDYLAQNSLCLVK